LEVLLKKEIEREGEVGASLCLKQRRPWRAAE